VTIRGEADVVAARNCPLCGSAGNGATHVGSLKTTIAVGLERDRYELVRCNACALLFLSPAPSARDLRAMYVDSVQFGDAVYTDPERVRDIVGYMTDCLTRMSGRARRNTRDPIAILEIGAGLAWMCRAAKLLDPRSRTVAQDISPEATARCAWVDRYVQDDVFSAALAERAPYDIVSLTHVIEHLVDPVRVIRRCRDLLRPDGVIFVTAPHRPVGWNERAPDIALWEAYSYNHVPAHTQYFSRRSMQALAQRTGCVLDHWSDAHEQGQAFEAWLRPAGRR
jgi:SAM-dependent methyltransferase